MGKQQSLNNIVLNIEQKQIELKIDECRNRSFIIREKHKSGVNNISVSFEGAHWIAIQLIEAAQRRDRAFFRKNKIKEQIIWLNKHENAKGQFIEIYKNFNGVGENVVVPAGDEGGRWMDMAEAIKLILNGGLKERMIKNRNRTIAPKGGARLNSGNSRKALQKSNGGRMNVVHNKAASYADAVKVNRWESRGRFADKHQYSETENTRSRETGADSS